MTVRAYGDCVFNSVVTAIGKTHRVVDFEIRATVSTKKRGFSITEFAYTVGAVQHFGYYIRVPFVDKGLDNAECWFASSRFKSCLAFASLVFQGLSNASLKANARVVKIADVKA